MTIFRTYSKDDRDFVARKAPRDVSTVVIDPGATGVALGWPNGLEGWPCPPNWRCSIGSNAAGMRHAAQWCAEAGVELVLIEDQFIARGKSARSMIRLTQSAGLVVGHILQRCETVREVVWMTPGRAGWGQQVPAGRDLKAASERHAVRLLGRPWLLRQGPSELQQACADCVGMIAFYEKITQRQLSEPHDVGF